MKRNRLKYHSLLAPQDWMPPANFKGSKRSWLILLAQNQIVVYFNFCGFFFFFFFSTKENIKGWTPIAEEQLLKGSVFCAATRNMSIFRHVIAVQKMVSATARGQKSVTLLLFVLRFQIRYKSQLFPVYQSAWTCKGFSEIRTLPIPREVIDPR